jgi:hypothetical protein
MRYVQVLGMMAILSSVGGCVADEDDDEAEQADEDGKEDGVTRPLGSYRTEPQAAGPSKTLTLRSDKTFARDTATTHEQGKYQFTSSGTRRYLRLLNGTGTLIVRYEYQLVDGALLLRATANTWVRYVKTPAWNVNQVSILFPEPKQGEDNLLLAMREGSHELLSEALFKRLGDGTSELPRLVEAAGERELYGNLRVTSARIDPCFDGQQPCVRQVRLAAQVMFPLPGLEGSVSLSDASIHLFYKLDDTQFVTLLERLHQLEAKRPITGPLRVHPLLAADGLASVYARGVRQALSDACSTTNLTRFTFMATGRSKNWFFYVLDRGANGTFEVSPVPGVPSVGDGFEDHGLQGYRTGNPFSVPWFPDALTRTDSTRALTNVALSSGLDQLARLANPDLTHTADVNCSACHVVDTTRVEVLRDRGLTTFAPTPSQFMPLTPRGTPAPRMGNLHAFAWFNGEPTVSERTANESVRVTEQLAGQTFWDSLTPQLRARLVW